MRVLFALMGGITLVSAGAFLVLFKPPENDVRLGHLKLPEAIFWLGIRERLMAFGLLLTGLRLLIYNLIHPDVPITFDNRWDELTTLATVILVAMAASVSLAVYLRYRIWEHDEE